LSCRASRLEDKAADIAGGRDFKCARFVCPPPGSRVFQALVRRQMLLLGDSRRRAPTSTQIYFSRSDQRALQRLKRCGQNQSAQAVQFVKNASTGPSRPSRSRASGVVRMRTSEPGSAVRSGLSRNSRRPPEQDPFVSATDADVSLVQSGYLSVAEARARAEQRAAPKAAVPAQQGPGKHRRPARTRVLAPETQQEAPRSDAQGS
jgi:hypothetical protein